MANAETETARLDRPASQSPGRSNWRQRLPFYYGWLIVASGFMILGITLTVWYSFSVFYVALLEEFPWTRAASAGVFSVFVVVNGLSGVVTGTLVDRFGPGRVVSVGVVILASAMVACSTITDLPQFYLYFGVIGAFGMSGSSWVPCVTMINRWFYRRLGIAIGIASAGIGVGIVAMVPASQMLISQVGWRNTYLVLAGIILVGVLPISLFLINGRPEDFGMQKDGRPMQPATGAPSAAVKSRIVDRLWTETDWSVRKAIATRRYWLLFLTMGIANVATQMIMVHEVAFLVDGGTNKVLAASVAGLVGLFSIPAKISWGAISDRIGRELTWSLGLACTVVGIFILVLTRFTDFLPVLYLFPLVFAFGYGATAPLTPAVSADLFSGRRYGSIYGTLTIANGVGSAFGSWFAGHVFDLTGSYFWAFGTGAACAVISITTMWLIAPRKIRRVPGKC